MAYVICRVSGDDLEIVSCIDHDYEWSKKNLSDMEKEAREVGNSDNFEIFELVKVERRTELG